MNTRTYFQKIQEAVLAAPHVSSSSLTFDEITETEGYIRGNLLLSGSFELHIAEYVITEPEVKRLKYRYHLQTQESEFIARWDNAPHHPEVSTHPDHLHLAHEGVKPSSSMDIEQVLIEVLGYLPPD